MRKINEKGITLIALIVTIIVLIILAGISINLVLGENGIITRAQEAKEAQEQAEQNEQIATNELMDQWDSLIGEKNIPPIAEIPEKSNITAFNRSYGVIEIEFLQGTGYKTTTTPNEPKLGANMKKVYWEDDGTERVEGSEEFDDSKWYNYTDTSVTGEKTSKWANAVTVDESGKITGYFVWIPRYAYRIVYFNTEKNENNYRTNGTITGIVGYSDSRGFVHPDGTTPSDMESPVTSISVGENKLRPHPAFEDGRKTGYTQGEWNTALEGIWIAKYETRISYKGLLESLPGVSAVTSIDIERMYTDALSFSEINKSHMLKNSEWGAIAYITDSKYGRNGIKVSQNIGTNGYTAGGQGATVKDYPSQSTTGNYYGIYDTSGGAYEYVTAYIADASSKFGNSFASTDNTYNNKEVSTEYATVYNMVSSSATNQENYIKNINKKFGDAMIETSINGKGGYENSWYLGTCNFFGVDNTGNGPFLRRGGARNSNKKGLFDFDNFAGNSYSLTGFRLALSIE